MAHVLNLGDGDDYLFTAKSAQNVPYVVRVVAIVVVDICAGALTVGLIAPGVIRYPAV